MLARRCPPDVPRRRGGSAGQRPQSAAAPRGPRDRTSLTERIASRSSWIQSASCCATSRTVHASASLRLRATPASISVSRTRRSARRSLVITGTPAVVNSTREPPQRGAPRDGAPEGRLRLLGDADARRAAVLPVPADPGLLGYLHLLLTGALGELGRGERAHDLNLVGVDLNVRRALEPPLGDASGEPGGDQPFLLGTRGRGPAVPARSAAAASPAGPWGLCMPSCSVLILLDYTITKPCPPISVHPTCPAPRTPTTGPRPGQGSSSASLKPRCDGRNPNDS